MYAAPFDNDTIENNSSDEYINNKKRQTHNKTQKRYPKENFDVEKVNSVLEKIHSKEEDEDTLGDFNPPSKPQSSGVQKTIATEQMSNMSKENNDIMLRTLGRAPEPNYEGSDNLELNNFSSNYGDSKSAEEYYKKFIPGYQAQAQGLVQGLNKANVANRQYYNSTSETLSNNSNDILLQKLNYMINLLEEKQDEKTNNVTEEVVLYSFLGIFIIFVVDSFAKVGKYVR